MVRVVSTVTVKWELQLLGSWELRRGAQPVEVGARQQRFLAALALLGQRSRSYLAAVLWPESSEARAAGSLRTCMFEVSHQLPHLIRTTNGTLALEDDVSVDVGAVRRLIHEIHTSGAVADPLDAVDLLAVADLLPGWYEDWIVFAQERLTQERLAALEHLATVSLERDDPALAIRAANAAVAIEPLRESAHLLLVRAHLHAGNYASAHQAHLRVQDMLERELGVGVSPRFRELLASARPR